MGIGAVLNFAVNNCDQVGVRLKARVGTNRFLRCTLCCVVNNWHVLSELESVGDQEANLNSIKSRTGARAKFAPGDVVLRRRAPLSRRDRDGTRWTGVAHTLHGAFASPFDASYARTLPGASAHRVRSLLHYSHLPSNWMLHADMPRALDGGQLAIAAAHCCSLAEDNGACSCCRIGRLPLSWVRCVALMQANLHFD